MPHVEANMDKAVKQFKEYLSMEFLRLGKELVAPIRRPL